MNKLEHVKDRDSQKAESNGWSDMSDSLEHNKTIIDLGEVDRSTEVGW